MNINEAFPSKYLKAADIEGAPIVTIAGIENEEVGKDKEVRPVLYFEGEDKGIILNKTNATNISKAYGYETDDWIGKQVQIGTTMVDFQGQSVEAIRIYPPKRPATAGTGKKFGQYDQSPQPGGNRQFSDQSAGPREFAPLDDDIPF